MAIPDFQSIMLPLLKLARDGHDHSVSEAIEKLAKEFRLDDAELREMLPSGRDRKFANRLRWAIAYLKKAELIRSTGRGTFQITKLGLDALSSQFPMLTVPQQGNKSDRREKISDIVQTPEETLEASYQKLKDELACALLENTSACSPQFFERLVVDLLVAMGYGGSRKDAGSAVGQSGDGGIDGIIKEDKLGLDVVYIQAKRWQNTVGRPEVQAFAGSLEGHRARKGVFITTSKFSSDAIDYVGRIEKKIILINGHQLADLMIEHGIGVAEVASYTICKVDSDYFVEE